MSSILFMDSSQPLLPYNNDMSAHPYFLSYKNSKPHFSGENSTHLLPYTCLPRNGENQCPLVITLLVDGHVDIIVRVTEPYYPRPEYQTRGLIRQGLPTTDEPYSYHIPITLLPGLNHVSWCASAPITFSASTRYFPYHRPNIWILPRNPSTLIQYLAAPDPTSTMSPYLPTPYSFLSPYPFHSVPHPPFLGVVFTGVPPSFASLSLLRGQLASFTLLWSAYIPDFHPQHFILSTPRFSN
jgi:hypothetical protein